MILQLILSRLVKTWYINLRQIRNSTKDVLIETKYRSVNVKQSLFKARWSNSSLCLGLEFCVFISIQDKKKNASNDFQAVVSIILHLEH